MAADAEGLFVAHHQQLFRYLCRAVGHADAARDLTQDVFVRVSRATVPDAPANQVRAWLFRIARNVALDHHRHRLTRPEAAPMVESGRPPSQHVAVMVNQALARLQDLDRDVFLMREVAGLSYEEIAGACDITEDAVRSRLHRTRTQLREWLADPIRERRSAPLRQRPLPPRSS
jgi:RNA polymerase sigma-70 factor (ECF subfamily)